MSDVGIALEPRGERPWLADAIVAGGALVVPLSRAEGLVWAASGSPDRLEAALASATHLRWVQLPFAGVEPFLGLIDDSRLWTCGKGVYADPVAEHALMLALAGLRGMATFARARTWTAQQGTNLLGAKVTIVGGGGITRSLVPLLQPFGVDLTVVRRSGATVSGAARVLTPDRLVEAMTDAEVVFLALAYTAETRGIIGAAELAAMADHGWLVNVARGGVVDTDALVDALAGGVIGGAGLDVTEPEPLPDDHALWQLPNCLITPHTGNTLEMARPLLAARVTENVRRFVAGEELIGLVDSALGY